MSHCPTRCRLKHRSCWPLVNKLYDQKCITFKQLNYSMVQKVLVLVYFIFCLKSISPLSLGPSFKIPANHPIVSDRGSESYRIAEYIDYYINPLARLHPSYIKDTYDFVAKLKNLKVPKETLLFSIDMESLYTNVDTERGLRVTKLAFPRLPQLNSPR